MLQGSSHVPNTHKPETRPALWVLAIIQFKDAVELLSQLGFYGWSSLFRMTESTQGCLVCLPDKFFCVIFAG